MSKLIKMIADRLIAALALIILSPLIMMIAIVIYLQMVTPILFTRIVLAKMVRYFPFASFAL
ncbi:MAG: hypothetical protein AAGF83_17500 [Cyanobacteria bacterium P01_G01_bin.67]